MSLTYNQSRAIDIAQKTVSSCSVVGEFLVIATFLAESKFRKPLNRLVFYATFGNIFTNMATLIGQSAIRIGLSSPLCQFQAFLIQWLIPADALWVFAMALNVWLSFSYHWDAGRLKSLEWKYILLCYGIPFIPALVLLCIKSQGRGRVYGNAVIWCWTDIEWDFLRLAVFYGPVWVIILLTFAIYVRVGAVIWKWRRRVNFVGKHSKQGLQSNRSDRTDVSNPPNEIRRTDEVTVERETTAHRPLTRHQSMFPSFRPHSLRSRAGAVFAKRTTTAGDGGSGTGGAFNQSSSTNRASIRYFKCALLFFVGLSVVWIPSSVNRIYTLVYPDRVIFGLQFAAAFVLPLQGFFNSLIYFVTSIPACNCLWQNIVASCTSGKIVIINSIPSSPTSTRTPMTPMTPRTPATPVSPTAPMTPGSPATPVVPMVPTLPTVRLVFDGNTSLEREGEEGDKEREGEGEREKNRPGSESDTATESETSTIAGSDMSSLKEYQQLEQ